MDRAAARVTAGTWPGVAGYLGQPFPAVCAERARRLSRAWRGGGPRRTGCRSAVRSVAATGADAAGGWPSALRARPPPGGRWSSAWRVQPAHPARVASRAGAVDPRAGPLPRPQAAAAGAGRGRRKRAERPVRVGPCTGAAGPGRPDQSAGPWRGHAVRWRVQGAVHGFSRRHPRAGPRGGAVAAVSGRGGRRGCGCGARRLVGGAAAGRDGES